MATPTVQLFLIPGSSSLFPHMLLRYCNIEFTPHRVTMATISQVSGKGQVPLLVVHGESITENPAIAHAINQLAPAKLLFGSSPRDFVRVCEWMNWIAGPLHAQSWAAYVRPFRFTTDQSEQALAAVKESARLKTLSRFATIDSSLNKCGPWALGETFTAVDMYLVPFYELARNLMKDVDLNTEFPSWTRHVKAVQEIDAIKETFECERRMIEDSA